VVLTWPQPVDDFSQVYWTLFVNGSVSGYPDRLGPPTQTLLGLAPETTYTFQVSLRDLTGNTVTGPQLDVTTPAKTDEQAPTAPTGLRADTPDGLDLELFWNASTDDTCRHRLKTDPLSPAENWPLSGGVHHWMCWNSNPGCTPARGCGG
jgi:hypothetical protein